MAELNQVDSGMPLVVHIHVRILKKHSSFGHPNIPSVLISLYASPIALERNIKKQTKPKRMAFKRHRASAYSFERRDPFILRFAQRQGDFPAVLSVRCPL